MKGEHMTREAALLEALCRFATVLPSAYDAAMALEELTDTAVELLDLSSSGVSLEEAGHLRFVTASDHMASELELAQERLQEGPCHEALRRGVPVTTDDLPTDADRWPLYGARAAELGIRAVAGLPMRLAGVPVGALNLYSTTARTWSTEDVDIAQVLADAATGYVVNAVKLHQRERLSEQLQHALTSRVVVEQAKGITANDRGVGVDEAFEIIRSHARSHNASLHDVATAIVSAGMRVRPAPGTGSVPPPRG